MLKQKPFVLDCCKGCPIQVAMNFSMLQEQSSHTRVAWLYDPIRPKIHTYTILLEADDGISRVASENPFFQPNL